MLYIVCDGIVLRGITVGESTSEQLLTITFKDAAKSETADRQSPNKPKNKGNVHAVEPRRDGS